MTMKSEEFLKSLFISFI